MFYYYFNNQNVFSGEDLKLVPVLTVIRSEQIDRSRLQKYPLFFVCLHTNLDKES